VGWGRGEDEEAGAILKVYEALGIFYFGFNIDWVKLYSGAVLFLSRAPLLSPSKGEGRI